MAEKKTTKKQKYWEAVGRRKTSSARVRLWPEGKGFVVNEKKLEDYFSRNPLIEEALSPLKETETLSFGVTVVVNGGGTHSQAQAIRHGLARALVDYNPELRKQMRDIGFLTRDSRMKERKKPGLKGARKAPQWSKR